MANGIAVKCSKCLTGHLMYDDIQQVKNGNIYGSCPKCGEIEGYPLDVTKMFNYNAGDGEHGVSPHLDEDDYHWQEFFSSKGFDTTKGDVRGVGDAFDQDNDLIAANLGWT